MLKVVGIVYTRDLGYTKGCFFLKECEYTVGRERFDPFIHKYMKAFQFQSLTTEQFLDFLKAELPEVFEKVDVQTWIYKPGMPETWHRPHSHLYDEVEQALADFKTGKLPTRDQVKDWHRYQILSFLQGLPKTLSIDDCKTLEDVLELEKRNDDYFLSYFYAICILSGYSEILPRVEAFVGRIGRMLYLLPIVRAMAPALSVTSAPVASHNLILPPFPCTFFSFRRAKSLGPLMLLATR